MIQTTVFYVINPEGNPTSIEKLHASFGTDLPQYTQSEYTDPRGIRYLLCVTQSPVEVLSTCSALGFLCGTPSLFEAEESQFNATYKIVSDNTGFHLLPIVMGST